MSRVGRHATRFGRALHKASAPLVVMVLLWAPRVSEACSQCLATRTRENQLAFIWTTVLLSVMPLLVVGGIAFWLRQRLRAAAAERNAPPNGEATDPALAISPPALIH